MQTTLLQKIMRYASKTHHPLFFLNADATKIEKALTIAASRAVIIATIGRTTAFQWAPATFCRRSDCMQIQITSGFGGHGSKNEARHVFPFLRETVNSTTRFLLC
ncbi:hypothetical protein D8M27_01980 [Corynebacterium pseudodiphtheriticum]|nr:hypothetical protein D8M37_03835 [Corynebacterium pseudodiphtheriticum]RUP92567.1 hypothetical protein D8M19_07980 [Corynebacterium pseudodiphtheriticum]RUP97392.1 hypothetical protein D8M27_01980 [Corynebacterium pseudodiphtheriticum]RUQ00377.1 hypothetical protein D8M32_01985 [Corynebacterium pseudodiphtheriticum]RUQ01916.1 hypothetical protein D8M17_02310 [Corynebacterium pseudodiphtheriticum]